MTDMVWEGNRALRPYLVPINELRAHERNPRRGNTAEIGRSIDRFGQQRPILSLPDGTIVAGHHVWRTCLDRGWTHLAAIASDLTGEEVDAYLLADNGTADLGYYDEKQLAELLQQWDDPTGTGFTQAEAQTLVRQMLWMPGEDLHVAARAATPREQPLARGTATEFNIILTYEPARYERVTARLQELAAGSESYSDTLERILLG